jgi:hypothetical protein
MPTLEQRERKFREVHCENDWRTGIAIDEYVVVREGICENRRASNQGMATRWCTEASILLLAGHSGHDLLRATVWDLVHVALR